MDFSRLEKNLYDVIEEEQIKLGYRRESVRLYYPLQSLNRLLGTSQDIASMQRTLETYFETGDSSFGRVMISGKGNRFCLTIPEEGVEFVHQHSGKDSFLREFIAGIEDANRNLELHGAAKENQLSGIEKILQIFRKFSDCVHFEKISNGEFDYLIYFEDGKPDDFRYCITDEGCHLTYHRFTLEDYEDFHF